MFVSNPFGFVITITLTLDFLIVSEIAISA